MFDEETHGDYRIADTVVVGKGERGGRGRKREESGGKRREGREREERGGNGSIMR